MGLITTRCGRWWGFCVPSDGGVHVVFSHSWEMCHDTVLNCGNRQHTFWFCSGFSLSFSIDFTITFFSLLHTLTVLNWCRGTTVPTAHLPNVWPSRPFCLSPNPTKANVKMFPEKVPNDFFFTIGAQHLDMGFEIRSVGKVFSPPEKICSPRVFKVMSKNSTLNLNVTLWVLVTLLPRTYLLCLPFLW